MDIESGLTSKNEAVVTDYLWGHPKGMYVIFLTEMWERFSFYGMRALLIFYLTQHFLYDDSDAFVIYGSYLSLVYITPIIGGYIADHYLGYGKTLVIGAVLMIFGHFGMALEGLSATSTILENGTEIILRDAESLQVFYLSLAFLVVGVGFLGPSIYTLLGQLYPESDHKREVGFIFFGMGINVGAGLAAFICGYLGMTYGWSYGFGCAGLGMCIGLLIFLAGRKHVYGSKAESVVRGLDRNSKGKSLRMQSVIFLCTICGVLIFWKILQFGSLGGYLVVSQFVLVMLGVVVYATYRLKTAERRDIFAVLFIMAVSTVYAVYIEQYGITISLFTLRHVDLATISGGVQAAQLQGLLAIFIICTAPMIIWLTNFLASRQRNPRALVKMGLGFVLLGLGYLSVRFGITRANEFGMVSAWFLVIAYLFWGLCTNLFIPITTSLITKLSPKNMTAMLMGAYMLALSVGYFGASIVAQWAAVNRTATSTVVDNSSLRQYSEFFSALGFSAIIIGIALFSLDKIVSKYVRNLK